MLKIWYLELGQNTHFMTWLGELDVEDELSCNVKPTQVGGVCNPHAYLEGFFFLEK